MKNKLEVIALSLTLMVSMASIVGCSNSNSTSTEASVSNNDVSINSSAETTIDESSIAESSSEISYETTSTAESIVSSNSSAVDPDVEERSYSKEEKTEFQDTKIANYKYYPASGQYYYLGNESIVTIQSVFSTCPIVNGSTVKEIIIPETIKSIPKDAFVGCPNLEKLVILNPNCEIERERILPKADPNDNTLSLYTYNNKPIAIYFYFKADKTDPHTNIFYNIEDCSKVFEVVGRYYSGEDYNNCLHDLATESYE